MCYPEQYLASELYSKAKGKEFKPLTPALQSLVY